MTVVTDQVMAALERGMRVRPRVGGFPYLAEALRAAGVVRYVFDVPTASVLYVTAHGAVVKPGIALVTQATEIAAFDADALVAAIRADQRGESDFPTFVARTFAAGVVRYSVDTTARTCTYFGALGDAYVEEYPAVTLPEEVAVCADVTQ